MEESRGSGETKSLWHLWVLAALLIGTGCYCQYLNQALYQTKAPFFDSLRYYDRLYDVVSICQQDGILPAARNAITTDSTFCLPYLATIPIGLIMEPSRAIGVWVEVIYFAVFVFSFATYLRIVRRADSRVIVGCCFPIFLLGALYRSTTGISDFRVDLPMAWLYVATGCWWLIGRESQRWNHFFLAGACAGFACLSRAIAPIYLTCGFLPLIIADLAMNPDRKKRVLQALLVLVTAIAISFWFYAIQFKFLYFYYVQWNTDANAAISFARSLRHFVAALKSIGPAAAVFFVFVFMFTREHPHRKLAASATSGNFRHFSTDFYWLAWMALAPILLLIVKRADINPFVSLPGAIALLTFWIVSQFHRIKQVSYDQPNRFCIAGAGLLAVALITGYLDHTKNQPATAEGHRKVLQIIEDDMLSSGQNSTSFSVNLLSALSSASLESMLQFERDSRYVNATTLEIDGMTYTVSHEFLLPSQENWNRIPGETVTEKIEKLEQAAAAELDYLISPTSDSISSIQAQYHYSFSSRFAEPILNQLNNSGNWIAISEPIQIEPGIQVRVYRNSKLD